MPPIEKVAIKNPNLIMIKTISHPIIDLKNKIDSQFLKILAIAFLAEIAFTYLISDPIAMRLGVTGFDDTFSTVDNFSIWSALLIAPIIEELLFRFHLSGKREHAYCFLIPLFITMLVFITYWYFCLIGAIIFLVFIRGEAYKFPEKKELSSTLFYTIFIITAVMFSSLHYVNIVVENEMLAIFLVIIALTPSALLFGYVRYKKGLLYAIVFHSLSNLTTFILNDLIYH